MFRVSFHFDCIYFRGTSMIFPYLPITCSQFVLEHRSCMLIYILQWLPWPGSWVTAAATRWSSYLLPGTAQKRIVGSCIRDRHRRNEEGGSCNWICLLKSDMEPNSSSDESGGEGRAGSWHWALIDRVLTDKITGRIRDDSGFSVLNHHWRWCFSGCLGEYRREARYSEALCCHFCRDVTRPTTRAWAASCNARCPHSRHSAHGALNLCYWKAANHILSSFGGPRMCILTHLMTNNKPDVQFGQRRYLHLFV